ncbi:tetratricopeptide repeat protein [Polaromonas sp. YR568]|uniref:tetratricopeptide repeat protein n=1 Tax=Polaromonas sp. YR568 TaxID=1855301 RepID=UPI0031382A37
MTPVIPAARPRVVFVPAPLLAQLNARVRQGLLLQQQGRFEEARTLYQDILQIHPEHVDALHLSGVVAFQTGRAADAIAPINRAIALQPGDASFHFNLGLAQAQLGRHDAALASHEQAIALKPDFVDAHVHRGQALRALGQHQAALASYDRALALRPQDAETHFRRAAVLRDLQQPESAVAAYDTAVSIRPDYPDAHFNRGNLLRELKRPEQAVASYDLAIAQKPDYAKACLNRGVALYELNRLEDALASYDRAIRYNAGYADAFVNRGICLYELRRLDEAVASYDQALALQPDYPEAMLNKSLTLLLQGKLLQGWDLYEWRWRLPASAPYRPAFAQPCWSGREPVEGKTILLVGEQGFGDFVQFSRYASLLSARGATVVLQAPPSLASVLKDLAGVSRIVVKGEPLPPFDLYCPLLSLPKAFGTDMDTIPSAPRYLQADPRKVAHWRAELDRRTGDKTRLRIGLVWSGNPTQGNDRNRSMALSALVPHLPVNHQYVSLQKDVRPADRLTLERHSHILHLGDELKDFSDTAVLCELMDLVLTVDTSVAHLSGALGRPTWVMVAFVPDWRWLLEREGSPWYPSIKLYRQPARDHWANVFSRLWVDLKQLQA